MRKFFTLYILSFLMGIASHTLAQKKTDVFMGELVNYDESAVPKYTLPELFRGSNGHLVKTRRDWEKERRPEIITLFKQNVYGQVPSKFDSIRFILNTTNHDAMEGRATLKQVTVKIWNRGNHIEIPLVLFVPNNINKPAPVFLLINNRNKRNTDPTREVKSTFWPAELLIEKGYAIAAFHVADAAPDKKDSWQHGVIDQLFPEMLGSDEGMKAIGAWAWAASRIMDYFETDRDLDAKRVSIVGHSRGGKTSLWAAALDERFAMVFSSCSGSTGASLARRKYGETVSLINKQFGYWFAGNYAKYSQHVDQLPIDQHMLIAAIAPRPVYTTNAVDDRWADPKGSYLSLVNALPVYKLYQKPTHILPDPPAIDHPILTGFIGYHFRKGIHDLNVYDWENFIRFADNHYKHGNQPR